MPATEIHHNSNPDPRYQAPKNLERAKADRIAALEAVINSVAADKNRKSIARRELENIEDFGYSYPACSGWPQLGPVYSAADQEGM